jgi:flagellar biosynthesis protein FlhF
MEVRSYYATTVEAAMMLAKQELGADALLIQSARAAPELAHLGKYEVVFAGELQPPLPRHPAKTQLAPKPAASAVSHTAIDTRRPATPEMDFQIDPQPDLRIVLKELPGLGPIDLLRGRSPDLRSPAFIALLARVAAADSSKPSRPPKGIACSPGLGAPGESSPAVALAGPCGSGKTTTIMKLALIHGLLVSRPIRILALDPQRVGATVRLQNFAEILSLSFTEFETPGQLSRALQFPFDGLTLIDAAPGALAVSLQSHPRIETQLVLRADRKTADNLNAMEGFSQFSPTRLILTALDQTADHTDLPTLISRSSLPVSFLSFGERIPEDLEPASSERLITLTRADLSRPGAQSRNARSAA